MKRVDDYKRNTEHMGRAEKLDYTVTYYWYHMLGILAAAGIGIFLITHIAFAKERPEFTCVLVNQEIDYDRDERMEERIADYAGLEEDEIVFDSDFQISYRDVQMTGANESSYEKFFFKWNNEELDAVIMPESFYRYCKELGGSFRDLDGFGVDGLPLYEDAGRRSGVYIERTRLAPELANKTGEPLLLVFPSTGLHEENCGVFLHYIAEIGE